MASLNPNALVMAKVTDFGETRAFAVRLKGRDGLMNPFWLAPEVMMDKPYSEKMDVFPYGIILWELHVRQHPYSEFPVAQGFASQLENAIIDGLRPTFGPKWDQYKDLILPLPHPEFITLAEECWSADPDDRPDFQVVLNRLYRIRIKSDCETQPQSWTRRARSATTDAPRNLLTLSRPAAGSAPMVVIAPTASQSSTSTSQQ